MNNSMKLEFLSLSENEGFARAAVSAFVSQLNPTLDELDDIKTAVSEAVTNAIVHAYQEEIGVIHISCTLNKEVAIISVSDTGRGIEDITLARTPLYTGAISGERSGLGFTVMETFMDSVEVISAPGKGTTITMEKRVGACALSSACVS
ncbi:MAG: anti-sigma F factor [Clostridia bacterium]|nr:anti-sigma F factor [Clostridia bacterium]